MFTIEGYDCQIIVSPKPNYFCESVDEEVKQTVNSNFEIENTGDWSVYVNGLENHLITFNHQEELLRFLRLVKARFIETNTS